MMMWRRAAAKITMLHGTISNLCIIICLHAATQHGIVAFGTASSGVRQSLQVGVQQQQHDTADVDPAPLAEPTQADVDLERWCREQSIEGLHNVAIRTTPRSVGNRGLFLSSWGECKPQGGDVLARIPAHLVMTQSRCERRWPSLFSEDNKRFPSDCWPVLFASYAAHALEQSYLEEDDDDVNWSPWIQSWLGTGDENDPNNPKPPRPPSSYDALELESMAKDFGSNSQLVQEALEARYRIFLGHQQHLLPTHTNDRTEELYSVVLSRTAQLGPMWAEDDRRGIIPLHDLINHAPRGKCPNVELFTVGDLRHILGTEEADHLIQTSLTDIPGRSQPHRNTNHSNNHVPAALPVVDRDILLIARNTIQAGDELFLSYQGGKTEFEEKQRVWLSLQYGFPF
mmetsp:Transcript_23731/g.38812  ORF Transcript_23731/g.38812 Transcript_23731/m.38812 type:complete len:399 (-) Transcript_23731:69-1265(-)